MKETSPPLPSVTCTSCGRIAQCKRVPSGTVYRPITWLYPDKSTPLEGVCYECQQPATIGPLEPVDHADPDAPATVEPSPRLECWAHRDSC